MESYKRLLILSYFNTVLASYSYIEISELFGLNYQQVENFINQLSKDGYLQLDGYYKLTDKGKSLLQQNNLYDIDIFEMNEDENIFTNSPLNFNQIYIPKNFTSKIK